MGINGLLKGLKNYSRKSHICEFSHQSIAVDASSWLHKSVYSISEHYVESYEKSRVWTDRKCVDVSQKYIAKRCRELFLNANLRKIYLVFDGKRCPLKARTNQEREERRRKNLSEARRYKKMGRYDKAQEKYKACIKIVGKFANAVSDAVQQQFGRDGQVVCVFSPYEADAQLVKLCLDGLTQAIITELDRDSGQCDVIGMDWLLTEDQPNKDGKKEGALQSVLRSLAGRQTRRPGLGVRLFVQCCVLSGSDYSPNRLNGVGLVNSFKLIRDNAHRDCDERFACVLSSLSKKARGDIDAEDYESNLVQSEAVFYYHPVLQLRDNAVVYLSNPYELQPSQPSLAQFGQDIAFLGRVDQGAIPPPIEEDARNEDVSQLVPREIFVSNRKKKRKSRNDSNSLDDTLSEDDVVSSVLETVSRKSKKPCRQLESNTVRKEVSGQFSKYARKEEAKQPSGVHVYLKDGQDVRFIKPRFRSDGKRETSLDFERFRRQKPTVEPIADSRHASSKAAESLLQPMPKAEVKQARPEEEEEEEFSTCVRRGASQGASESTEQILSRAKSDEVENIPFAAPPSRDRVLSSLVHPQKVGMFNEFERPDDEDIDEIDNAMLRTQGPFFGSLVPPDRVEVLEECERTAGPLRTEVLNLNAYRQPPDDEIQMGACTDVVDEFNTPHSMLPFEDAQQSRYFSGSKANPRRVTLDSPTKPLAEECEAEFEQRTITAMRTPVARCDEAFIAGEYQQDTVTLTNNLCEDVELDRSSRIPIQSPADEFESCHDRTRDDEVATYPQQNRHGVISSPSSDSVISEAKELSPYGFGQRGNVEVARLQATQRPSTSTPFRTDFSWAAKNRRGSVSRPKTSRDGELQLAFRRQNNLFAGSSQGSRRRASSSWVRPNSGLITYHFKSI